MEQTKLSNQLKYGLFEFQAASQLKLITRREIERKAIINAIKDESFKNNLINRPKEVLEEINKIRMPQDLSISVIEETDDDYYFILPHNPYEGINETELRNSLGVDMLDIAKWVLERQVYYEDNKIEIANIISKSWTNPEYKKLLLVDPILLLRKEFGESLKVEADIKILEETENHWFIVIPKITDETINETNTIDGFVNMPMVVGSHQNTAGFLGNCSTNSTHNNTLFCTDTRSPEADCKTVLDGWNGCGGPCRFFSLIVS
ncbi:NHLP leader peptide family RiPP precursor [Spirosoma sp. KNUC1025]|uniref:NHLP leader peptide family RiPP precursor n=1 Tax=Spirosoma sp. KNUC1025 TaxID=2894082 RepID=UPI00386E4619|nr:NHLP leader peptide family RiPP precursor [Spirosoma sp. KNUC1025]